MHIRKDASNPWEPNRPFQPEPEPPSPAPSRDPDWQREYPAHVPPSKPDRWIEEDLPGDPGTLPC